MALHVGVARTSLRDALASLLPRSPWCRRQVVRYGSTPLTSRSVTIVDIAFYNWSVNCIQAIREGNTIDLPDNVPDFILAYLNELNCDRLENEPNNLIS
ncbi:hypothetical protein LC653_14000 [Nostoc sp. CHAB 5784]|uniref:hypothetical protein n=1 Tax=Nostoc mirabile TaxID=2907820 RepID=UPI001E62207D|nr:hypothetical protein [Nostoc mirabile]MCC5665001.1 hypothetical protein [Nostoc mirabile CHAB5784]